MSALRLSGPADCRPEIHHRLDEIARLVGGHHLEDEGLRFLARDVLQPAQPRHHARDIGVDGRRLLTEGDRRDCG